MGAAVKFAPDAQVHNFGHLVKAGTVPADHSFRKPIVDMGKADRLKVTVQQIFDGSNRAKEILPRVTDMEAQGVIPDAAAMEDSPQRVLADFHSELKGILLAASRRPAGSLAFLGPDRYFTLTPNSPTIQGTPWEAKQILSHTAGEYADHVKEGMRELQGNSVSPWLSSAAIGLPPAGESSRAVDFFLKHREIVQRIIPLGGLEGVAENDLPPRYLYPIQTEAGPRTLLGMMMDNFAATQRAAGKTAVSMCMLNAKSVEHTAGRLHRDLGMWGQADSDNLFGFIQPSSPRMYLGTMDFTSKFFSTGHGDYSMMLARYNAYRAMKDAGVKYLVFGNADEFLYGADPAVIGYAKHLFQKGFNMLGFVVPNSNNQLGGGAVYETAHPDNQSLCEATVLPADLVASGKNPSSINTTFYIMSTEALADATEQLQTLDSAIDIKNLSGRIGACIDSWAGSEWSTRLRPAFVLAPRAGFFLGVKSLQHTHSDDIPPELSSHPLGATHRMSYQNFVMHMANTFPKVIRAMIGGDMKVTEAVFNMGGSYFIDPSLI